MNERKDSPTTELEEMTPKEAATAAVRTSAQVAADRAAAMAAGAGMPSHDAGGAMDGPLDPARQVAELTDELAQMKDSALRARADFENTRKRLLREKDEGIRYANANLIERLLPVFDSFELGLLEAKKHKGAGPIVKGFELVWKQMAEFLKENGVEPIEAEGQAFDPNLHQALGQQESADQPEGHVTSQVRKGYKLRDRLLRPAMVFVSKGPAARGA
jgi:molecular chaperone GrpE